MVGATSNLPPRAFVILRAVWTDICLANKNSLLDLIGGLRTQLSELERILSEEDRAALYRYFAAAKQTRDEWLERQ